VWNLHNSINHTDLVNGFNFWRETSMHTEDLALDDRSERKIIKDVGDVLPDIAISVLSLAFIVESIELRCLTGFMVAS
jgi:hypothetical protein